MSRQIFLPELISISIKNYTLYPNGLDYTYDFVEGVNLVLGGNGMGKTTFVNIIKFGLIGLYRKAKDLTRTYMERAIVKRQLYESDYFSARKDDSISTDGIAQVVLKFKINNTCFEVTRSLEDGRLLSVIIDGIPLEGFPITENRYERVNDSEQTQYLLYQYEKKIQEFSNLTFDDLIFFVNEILFFGENHNTVLWNDGIDGRTDVQNELFNKYFNEPALDLERQEMQRQAKYFDSLSRHKSEDMRVITKLLEKIKVSKSDKSTEASPSIDIIELKRRIELVVEELASIQTTQKSLSKEICILQGEKNRDSLNATKLDDEKKQIEKEMRIIADSGMEEILILTGESRSMSSVEYIGEACKLAGKYFKMVGLEIYPVNSEEYEYLHKCGADYVTVFQETYDIDKYETLHLRGHKRIWQYRFEAQERALMGGMRGVAFAALLGLSDFRKDAFATALHACYLQRKYPHAEISLSCPRLRPIINNDKINPLDVGERQLCQVICAYRIFLPFSGITVSSREGVSFRNGIMKIAATKVSAGVSTGIGDHEDKYRGKDAGEDSGDEQFEIDDARSFEEMYDDISKDGLQPVLNDYLYV